jgi:hypothetical protein
MSASDRNSKSASTKDEKNLRRHERDVRAARREVEARVEDLRAAVDLEFKWLPRGKARTLPLVGVACGLVMALGRRKDRRSDDSSKRRVDSGD